MANECVKEELTQVITTSIDTNNIKIVKLVETNNTNIKSYIDNQELQSKEAVAEAITVAQTPILQRLDFIDKIDSEDGVDTLIENFNKLNKLLESGAKLKTVTDAISANAELIVSLTDRVVALENAQKAIKTAQSALQTDVKTLTDNQSTFLTCEDVKGISITVNDSIFNIENIFINADVNLESDGYTT